MTAQKWADHQAEEIHRLRRLLKQARMYGRVQFARAEHWKHRALTKSHNRRNV